MIRSEAFMKISRVMDRHQGWRAKSISRWPVLHLYNSETVSVATFVLTLYGDKERPSGSGPKAAELNRLKTDDGHWLPLKMDCSRIISIRFWKMGRAIFG